MRRIIPIVYLMAGLAVLAGCARAPAPPPRVTHVVVNKGERVLYLMQGADTLRSYPIHLGFAPVGDKYVEGDGRTPEGDYMIDRRNPYSQFYLSLGIDYPRPHDRVEALAFGQSPGGDIFIHGEASDLPAGVQDWTAGCIALDNLAMREIWEMVAVGTPIRINP